MDLIHVDDREGHKVFNEEREAVKKLSETLDKSAKDSDKEKDKHLLSSQATTATQAAIASLVHADWVIAQTALNDAAGTIVLDPSAQEKVSRPAGRSFKWARPGSAVGSKTRLVKL